MNRSSTKTSAGNCAASTTRTPHGMRTTPVSSGSASDIPPRLPVGTQDTIDTLSALLHGYPEPGTDIEAEIGIHAEELRSAEPADRPGRLLVVMAVAWYAASDFVRNPAVLDELI